MIYHQIVEEWFLPSFLSPSIQCFGIQNVFFPIEGLEMDLWALRKVT